MCKALALQFLEERVKHLTYVAEQDEDDAFIEPADEEARIWMQLTSVRIDAGKRQVGHWLIQRLRYTRNLQIIVLCDALDLSKAVFAAPAFRAPTLTEIHFWRCRVTNAMVECIGNTCRALETFALYETTLPESVDPLGRRV